MQLIHNRDEDSVIIKKVGLTFAAQTDSSGKVFFFKGYGPDGADFHPKSVRDFATFLRNDLTLIERWCAISNMPDAVFEEVIDWDATN